MADGISTKNSADSWKFDCADQNKKLPQNTDNTSHNWNSFKVAQERKTLNIAKAATKSDNHQ
jgi:hypothetical protein